MKNTRKKIVALGTVLAIAFVLVAALVPVKEANAVNIVNDVTVNVVAPAVGSTLGDPEVTVPDGAPYFVKECHYIDKQEAEEITGDQEMYYADGSTVAEGDEFYLQVYLKTNEGSIFEINEETSRPMFTPKVNGGEYFGAAYSSTSGNDSVAQFVFKLTAKADTPQPPVDPSGGDDSGTPSSGTDGTSATTDSTGTTGSTGATSGSTANSAASKTATSTTKVKSPKTADVMPFVPVALVLVGAAAIGVIAIRRKNS